MTASSMLPGQSIRARSGALRIQFDPAWSKSRPFLTYAEGTATGAFTTLWLAKQSLCATNARWSNPS